MYDNRFDIDPFGDPINHTQANRCGEIVAGIAQGTEEWLALRCGCITSSKVSDMMAKGNGLTRQKYLNQLAIERITGKPMSHGFKSKSMQKGNDDEPLARQEYWITSELDVETVTFVFHPTIANAGASPDALVGFDGGLEIKCPDLNTHIEYLVNKKIPTNYVWQIQWLLACTGRDWFDWMSYAKELPPDLRKLIIRVVRDDKKIQQLESEAERLNNDVEQLIKKLRG